MKIKRNRSLLEENNDDLMRTDASSLGIATTKLTVNMFTTTTMNEEEIKNYSSTWTTNQPDNKKVKLEPSSTAVMQTDNTSISSVFPESNENAHTKGINVPPSHSRSSSSSSVATTIEKVFTTPTRSGFLSINDKKHCRIRVGTQLFKVLVLKSTVFVDKSLLIMELLIHCEAAENILVTYPRRWGKSLNMDMIKTFLEMEIDKKGNEIHPRENDKLFTGGNICLLPESSAVKSLLPLQISRQTELLFHYMGKFPVIYLNMQNIFSPTYEGIVKNIRLELRDLYTKYEYLLVSNNLSNASKDIFRTFLAGTIDDEETLKQGIKYLSEFLYLHHKKKVFILIDEYDAVINQAFVELDNGTTTSIVRLIGRIFQTSLKGNDYVERALITGVYRIAKSALFSELNNFVEIGILDKQFAPYYGFTDVEVNKLLGIYSIADTFSNDIKNWYNGYTIGKYQVYNPWSIVNVLSAYETEKDTNDETEIKNQILKSYHEIPQTISYLDNLFKVPEIRTIISDLVLGHTLQMELQSSISIDEYKVIKEVLLIGSHVEFTDSLVNSLFSYLFAAGYLTLCCLDPSKCIHSNIGNYVRVPNNEMRTLLAKKMLKCYSVTYKIKNHLFTNATDTLQKLLDQSNISMNLPAFNVEFTQKLNELFTVLPDFEKLHHEGIVSGNTSNMSTTSNVHGNEALLQMVIGYIAIQLSSINKFGLEVNLGEGRTDVAFTDTRNKIAVIIDLKYNRSVHTAVQHIKDKKYAAELRGKYPVVILGINLQPTKTVDVITEYIPFQQKN